MTNIVKPFGSIEKALAALLVAGLPNADWTQADWDDLTGDGDGLVGGDLAYEREQPWYIRIDKVSGRSDRFEGDFTLDVEVFGINYLETESRSLDIEALLLGYPHVVEVEGSTWVFDTVSQNTIPDELPWEDDEVSRLGATYVITARRR